MGKILSARQRRLMNAAINPQIRQYERGRELFCFVDNEVFAAGMELFESEAELALWLCEPARALGGKIPLRVIRTGRGKKLVAGILRGLAHGNIL